MNQAIKDAPDYKYEPSYRMTSEIDRIAFRLQGRRLPKLYATCRNRENELIVPSLSCNFWCYRYKDGCIFRP